jgi:hypothetical protein
MGLANLSHHYFLATSRYQSMFFLMTIVELLQINYVCAVKNLHLSVLFTECIAPALQDLVGERVTCVLPALKNIFLDLEEPQPWDPSGILDSIDMFVAARRDHGHPIAVH